MKTEKTFIKIKAKLSKKGKDIDFYILADPEKTRKTPRKKIEQDIERMLQEVRVDEPLYIKKAESVYDLVDIEKMKKQANYGNTVVEVNLPYCLHFPNSHSCEVSLPERGINAFVRFMKVWTEHAPDSSMVDIFSEDQITHFQQVEITTPDLPQKPKLGWELKFTGKNIEKYKDNTGYFRYSKLIIQFQTDYKKKNLTSKKVPAKFRREVEETAVEIVNRILDTYRLITGEEYVQRVGSINITNLFFSDHNLGFMLAPMGRGIKGATMNRSRREIQRIESMLSKGIGPPLYELLFLNAKASLNNRMFTLAVVESFQAMEIFLENFLIDKYKERHLSEQAINSKLKTTWRTKERLKNSLEEVTGHSLLENQHLWNNWCTMYDKTRIEVIHRGKEPGKKETEKAINLNRDVVTWIQNLN